MNQETKTCTKCGETKLISEFVRPTNTYRCKLCFKAYQKEWEAKNRERLNASKREWRAKNLEHAKATQNKWTTKNKERRNAQKRQWERENRDKAREQKRRYREKHPKQTAAHKAFREALRLGQLTKPKKCSSCLTIPPRNKLHGHHEDYSKPLEVIWLCQTCHAARHAAPESVPTDRPAP